MEMIVDSDELGWRFDVEDLSRSYRFLRAPEDKTRLHHGSSVEIWIMYDPPSLAWPRNGSQTE
jgi:hypothetical protein